MNRRMTAESPIYKLVPREVSPDDLLLDPNNPRLRTDDFKTQIEDPVVISKEDVQRSLMRRISEDEHEVAPLMESIRNQGFVELDALLVRRLSGGRKFVVVEGNRRTAAIKRLLAEKGGLSTKVERSLRRLPVKEIVCEDPSQEQQVVDSIVALRHISGPKDWEPMQRAYAVYNAYARQYRSRFGSNGLTCSDRVIREVAFMLGQEVADIKEGVWIFALFDALQKAGYQVRSDHYSLLQLTLSRPRLASEYFDFNRAALSISPQGLERLNRTFVDRGGPVKNPKDFRAFARVFQEGTPQDLSLIENGARSLDTIMGDMDDRRRETLFLDKLRNVLTELESLRVSSFRGSDEEADMIFRLKGFVDRRLWPLASKILNGND